MKLTILMPSPVAKAGAYTVLAADLFRHP
jgi:hypothetical protein